jgi:hypothetical protein
MNPEPGVANFFLPKKTIKAEKNAETISHNALQKR